MKITSSEFIISAVGPKQYPEGNQPEIALAGRSNVGKSSLINRLLNRKNLARTSGRPGKTQTLNFYHINQSFYFVDLPGYGFAKVPKALKDNWSKFINAYLSNRSQLRAIIQLIDIRHAPSKEDRSMFEWVSSLDIPKLVVVTKADKISRGNWAKHVKVIKDDLRVPAQVPVIIFSADTGLGKDEVWSFLEPFLEPEDEEEVIETERESTH